MDKKCSSKFFKCFRRKKHEAGWLSLLKIGGITSLIFIVLALVFGYVKTTSFSTLIWSGIQVGIFVVALVIFIVGLIAVSENTSGEVKKK